MIKKIFSKAIPFVCVCIFCFSIKSKTALGKAACEIEIRKKKTPAHSMKIEEEQKGRYPYEGLFIKI